MQIDWFTVAAEIVNFLILVALLKYLLYDRILQVADEREEQITRRFDEAEEKKRQAEAEKEKHQQAQQELDNKREEMLAAAKEEARQQRQELLDEARQAVAAKKETWQRDLQREKESFLKELRRRAGHHTYSVARRALDDLANAELEQQILNTFLARLSNLDDERRQSLAESVANGSDSLKIYSAFDIPDERRSDLLQAIEALVERPVEGQFQTRDDVGCGIELRFDGHKIGWSLDSYLDELEADLSAALSEEIGSTPAGQARAGKDNAGESNDES